MIKKIIHIALFLFIGVLQALAQNIQDLEFEHLTTERGLSQSIITTIGQDQRGFIWIGTEDGLNRYNGYQVDVFRRDFSDKNTISDNWIRDILLDSDGDLWFATHNGLSKYNPTYNNFDQYHKNPNNANSVSSNYIIALCEYEGDLWIGTGDEGISRYNKRTNTFTQYKFNPENPKSLPDNDIKCFLVDKSNTLWVGTNNGLARYDKNTDSFIRFQKGKDSKYQLTANEIRSLYEDSNDVLWVGTGSAGLNRFTNERDGIINFEGNPQAPEMLISTGINHITEDDKGTLWIATTQGVLKRDEGMMYFHILKNSASDPKSLTNNDVSVVFQDRSSMLWFGTKGGGVNIYDVHSKKFKHYKHDYKNLNSLSKDVVRAIFEDRKGILWIGLREGGLDKFDRELGYFQNFPDESNKPDGLWANTASAIYEDKEGVLWVGSWGQGLNRKEDNGTFTHFLNDPADSNSLSDNRIQAIFEDSDGNLWVATDGGMNLLNRTSGSFKRYTHEPDRPNSLSNNAVQSQAVFEDSDGIIWIGTYSGGLNRFDKRKNEFVSYHHNPKQPTTSLPKEKGIISLHGQGDVIWIGTDGGGLVRFNKFSQQAKIYTTENGVCSDVIYAIKPDRKGNLWLSTKNGLSRFTPNQEKFKNYYAYHGLQSNVFYWGAAHRSKKTGELFFGGINGLTLFHPAEIEDNSFVPPVYLTDFKINNISASIDTNPNDDIISPLTKHISLTKSIEIDYSVKYFSFGFTALNYSHPERNRYKYKMEPFDQEWIETSADNPHAPYTNLPAGSYTFKVMGSNNDGLWNLEPVEVTIVMVPPWYARTSTRLVGSLLLLGLVFAFYKGRVKFFEKQKRELIRQVQIRTAEITDKNEELEKQKKEIEKQNEKIQSSIQYAQRIQKAILPTEKEICNALDDYFILFKPRDVVSGDFYWLTEKNNKIVIAAVDCTGHGVPGAFMSMVGSDLLKEIVNMRGITEPSQILSEMHVGVKKSLHQDEYKSRDGMDIALCTIEYLGNNRARVVYSGAHNPLIFIRDGKLETLKANKTGIGGFERSPQTKHYEQHELLIKESTMIYLASDGYQDQFGGNKGRKIMSKNFKKLLLDIYLKPLEEQNAFLQNYFENWKQDRSQTDDVLVMGFRLGCPKPRVDDTAPIFIHQNRARV